MNYFINLFELHNNPETIVSINESTVNLDDKSSEIYIFQLKEILKILENVCKQIISLSKFMRNLIPYFRFLSEKCIFDILYNLNEPNISFQKSILYNDSIKSIKMKKEGEHFIIFGVENYNNEEYFFKEKIIVKKNYNLSSLEKFLNAINEIPKNMKEMFKGFFKKNVIHEMNYLQLWENYLKEEGSYLQLIFLLLDLCFFHNIFVVLSCKCNFKIKNVILRHKLDILSIKIKENIEKLIEIKSKVSSKNIKSLNQLIFHILYHKEILSYLIYSEVDSPEKFEYIALPKRTFGISKTDIENKNNSYNIENPLIELEKLENLQNLNLSKNSEFFNFFLKENNWKILLMTMNHQIPYGFQFLSQLNYYIYTTISIKLYITFISAISSGNEILLTGSRNSGKTEIIRVFFFFIYFKMKKIFFYFYDIHILILN